MAHMLVFKPFTLLFIITVLQFSGLKSQTFPGDLYLSAKTGYTSLKDFDARFGCGVQADYLLNNNLGIHYSLLFGDKFVHANGGPMLGFFIGREIVNDNDSTDNVLRDLGSGIFLGALFSIIPESISYNHKIGNKFILSPYVSPFQMDFIRDDEQKRGIDTYLGGGLGLTASSYLLNGNLKLSLQGEVKIHYNIQPHQGYFIGFMAGWRLRNKNNFEDIIE